MAIGTFEVKEMMKNYFTRCKTMSHWLDFSRYFQYTWVKSRSKLFGIKVDIVEYTSTAVLTVVDYWVKWFGKLKD